MVALDSYPTALTDILGENGADFGDAELLAKCDMNKDGAHCDCFLIATAKELFAVSGITVLTRRETRLLTSPTARRIDAEFTVLSFERYDLCDLDDFTVEELISSGRLTAFSKKVEGQVLIAVFTNTSKFQAEMFAKYIVKVKKGERVELDEEDSAERLFCPKCGARYPDPELKICPHCTDKGKLMRRLSVFLFKYKSKIALSFACLFVISVLGVISPYISSAFFYDEVLEICHEYDVTISLGDSCRPGCLYDSNDATETAEMIELGKLCKRAWAAGVQVMVEGPGHMALDEIASNMKLQKRLCHNAPFYVLGPLVTDIGVGYDHITAAIGGAISASSGADFLCYVTPAEHLCLPNAQDVLDGLMATKIAAHAADIAKKVPHARDMDDKMGQARRKLDWDAMWKCALDPVTGKKRYEESPAATEGTCTMCGKMCAVRTVNKVFEGTTIDLGMED